MKKISVKIRGIYTTALTKLLLNNKYSHEFSIVQPSRQIQERFRITERNIPEDILIRDKEDHQGLLISGSKEYINLLMSLFKAHFFDMVIRNNSPNRPEKLMDKGPPQQYSDTSANSIKKSEMEIEFPGVSKAALDSLRAKITPTLKNHHLLKIIASDRVELIERELYLTPFRQKELEKRLQKQVVFDPMREKGSIGLTHITPEGTTLSLRRGKILSLKNTCLIIKREFSGGHGRYDGLDLPIEEGDYGITEITEDQWSLKHSYYSRQGLIKGIYWNINTPIEFYPDHIRYLDLHIDVIQKPGDPPKMIDQEKLEKTVTAGFITRELAKKAYEIVHTLIHSLLDNPDKQETKR